MHERLTNLRPVIFLQFAAGTPRTEVWRGLHGAATLQSNCGKIVIAVSEDIDPTSMDAVLWSLAYRTNPIEDVHIVPYRGGVQGAQYCRQQDRLRPAGRRDAQAPDGAARAADARVHGARARAVGGARLAGAQRAVALARLHARRLDRHLGDLRAPHHRGRLGAERPRDAGAPAPRAPARDAGAARAQSETKRSFPTFATLARQSEQ